MAYEFGENLLVTPPNKEGNVNPYILAVANLLKVNEIYKVGGAQAVAALALGTKAIPKVDKIIGPGNMYVTEAKRQLFGYVDIDMMAGPTELVVIANRYSNTDYVVADLEAQMEHVGGLSILLSTSKQLIKDVRKRVVHKKLAHGYCIYCKNMDEAVEIANQIAPEHLQIATHNAALPTASPGSVHRPQMSSRNVEGLQRTQRLQCRGSVVHASAGHRQRSQRYGN